MTTTSSSSPLDTAKELAPWRANLAWWIILVEGIVLAAIGLLTLFNPEGADRDLALIFTAAWRWTACFSFGPCFAAGYLIPLTVS